MAINWNSLRNWNGDQRNSFEELCCQLLAQENVPAGSRFFRKGHPDAGLECYWQLPNGDEWGLQAKFFLTTPSTGQWSQINESVKHALAAHPRLTKYYVCLPIDRSDARIQKQKSFSQRWTDRVFAWAGLAASKNMAVEFEYWGESEIGSRLAAEHNRGRHWFWFSEERFSNEWFRNRIDDTVANAKDRFDPEFNVDLPIRSVFDALGRTPAFFSKLSALYSEAQIRSRKLKVPVDSSYDVTSKYDGIGNGATRLFSRMSPWVHRAGRYSERTVTQPIPWGDIEAIAKEILELTNARMLEVIDLLHKRDGVGPIISEKARDDLGWERHALSEFRHSIAEILDYSGSNGGLVSNLPYLLLTGSAGQGKTHLLCQVARAETYASRPIILFHGEQFNNAEPWAQMIQLLGLDCSREELIGGLEAAAQTNNCRVLIFIDALNEGEGNRLWSKFLPGMLTAIARSNWLGVCFSVRSSYERYVIPDALDESRFVRLEHRGFTERSYEATSRFFSHYGIEPSTPLLVPEFSNPLFLKLFCKSLRNQGVTRMPLGLRGITSIFQFYIDSLDFKLSAPGILDYDKRDKNVARSVNELAKSMAKNHDDRLPLNEAKAIIDDILPPRKGFQSSLFNQLESEGMITVVPDFRQHSAGEWSEYVRFTYQRFSDHMIVQHILAQYLDNQSPEKSFSKGKTLGKLIKDERACWVNSGLLGALMIQIPEVTKRELPDIVPHLTELPVVRDAFVESLLWREVDSFSNSTDNYVEEQILRYRGTSDNFWDTIITLSPLPGHPYNADRLHEVLAGFNIPNRDSWWSIFVHHAWGTQGSVDRLVAWAWEEDDKSKFDDEVIRLAGITLAWFLTTANRFLRDRATKALVRLFEDRLHVLLQVLEGLSGVDDPYVAERLLAVAYGCAMRNEDLDSVANLAQYVYYHVFASSDPPPHLLLRDYARGVIEVAICRGSQLDIDLDKIRPPYKSEWPSFSVPSEDDLEAWRHVQEGAPDIERSKRLIYNSVMGNALADFSHYVIGDLDEWSSERIDEVHNPTRREIYDQFLDSLTSRQKKAWDLYDRLKLNTSIRLRLGTDNIGLLFDEDYPISDIEPVVREAEEQFVKTLRPGSKKHKRYVEFVKDYSDNPSAFSREDVFDGRLARLWIMQRVINLGWTVERFGEFDRWVNYRHGRDTMKPERIGKKYQWLAYYELLARISDNFTPRNSSLSAQVVQYDGPWNLPTHTRDIDPSNLLSQTQADNWQQSSDAWWFPAVYINWDNPADEVSWLKTSCDIPEISEIIEVKDKNGSQWLALKGFYRWDQSIPPGEERYEFKRREVWYMVKSYLIHKSDMQQIREWASKQRWFGRWMPESHESYDIFLGEFFWSPAFKDQNTSYYSRTGWTAGDLKGLPAPVLVSDDEYGRSHGGFDCSIDDSIFMDLPCSFLVDGMNLCWKGTEGHWYDDSHGLVAYDPSVGSPGPRTLLIRRDTLIEFLESKDLTLFWTVLGEKQSIGGSANHQDYRGRLEINGSFFLDGGVVSGRITPKYAPPPSS